MDSYELGVICKYINNGENLYWAHNSMVYIKSQTNIVINKNIILFINCSLLVWFIYDTFSKN